MPEDKSKINEELEKKIDQKIDSALHEEIGPGLDDKIKEIVDSKLEEKITQEINEKVEQKTTIPEQAPPERINPFIRTVREFRDNFHLCWQGSCRTISWIQISGYILALIALLYCHFSNRCSATNAGIISTIVLYAVILTTISSLIISLFSKYPKIALMYWILLDIPIFIFLLFFTAKYIAFIIISLIIVSRIIASQRGY